MSTSTAPPRRRRAGRLASAALAAVAALAVVTAAPAPASAYPRTCQGIQAYIDDFNAQALYWLGVWFLDYNDNPSRARVALQAYHALRREADKWQGFYNRSC
jgi:hypothetical protein